MDESRAFQRRVEHTVSGLLRGQAARKKNHGGFDVRCDANGMHDYLIMLNERDGGVGGVPLIIEECETGYNTKKGVE